MPVGRTYFTEKKKNVENLQPGLDIPISNPGFKAVYPQMHLFAERFVFQG
jgi:hypothetical protein